MHKNINQQNSKHYKLLLKIISALIFINFFNPVTALSNKINRPLKKDTDTAQVNALLRIANDQNFKNIDSMFKYTYRALEVSKKIKYTKGMARSYHLIGRAYSAQSLFEKALENLLIAKSIYLRDSDEYNLCNVLLSIGNLYWYSEKFNEAREIYLETLHLSQKNGNVCIESGAYQNLGLVYGKLNHGDSALSYLKKAYYLQVKSDYISSQALTLSNIGDLYLRKQQYDSAVYFFKHALDKYDKLKPSSKAKLYISLAITYLKKGDIQLSKYYIKKAYPKVKEAKSLSALTDYYQANYQIDSVNGNFKNANKNLSDYYSFREKMLTENNDKKLAAYHTLYLLEKKEKEINKLKAENESIKFQVHRKKCFIIVSVIVLILLSPLILLIHKLFKIKVKKNKELELKNEELKAQKDQLQILNEEIIMQSEYISDKNNKLITLLNQLKEKEAQLIHSEKMASIGILAAGITHEVNTPLHHITGSLKILENSLQEVYENCKKGSTHNNDELFSTIKEMTRYINNGAEDISKIVNSLTTFSFRGKSKRTLENINVIIDNTLTLIHHYIPSNITVEKKYGNIPQVKCYTNLLHQVFINIITNAVNAIKIKELQSNEKIIIETYISEDNKKVIIKMANTGIQIPLHEISKIFDPFYTTKTNEKAAGLGLTICYNIIKEHRGTIDVRNLSNGVEFCISLPCK